MVKRVPIERLRSDVRHLGQVLGEVLVEQRGSDLLALVDCVSMAEFNAFCDAVLVADPTVRRYETSFVKREVKFAPFVQLGEA